MQLASARLGTVLVNINPAYQARELLYCLNKVMARHHRNARAEVKSLGRGIRGGGQ